MMNLALMGITVIGCMAPDPLGCGWAPLPRDASSPPRA